MNHPGTALEAVLFDLDGTLVDTADDFVPVVHQLQKEHSRNALDPDVIRASVSNGSRALVRLALDIDENAEVFENARQRLLSLYGLILGKFARPYPGVTELLNTLSEQSISWGIVTNKPRAYTLPLLKTLSLNAASIVCPEDVGTPKPHPESLHKACRELNCRESASIYIGDHSRDIEAGQRAGLFTIAAAYGYIEADDSPQAWGADLIAQRSGQLTDLLLSGETH